MPVKARRPCPHCKALITKHCECQAGRVQEQRKQSDRERGSAHSRGYDAQWQRFRLSYLRMHPLCRVCKDQGRVTMATEIHHVVELANGGEKYEHSNLVEMCHNCHSKHTAQTVGYGKGAKIRPA